MAPFSRRPVLRQIARLLPRHQSLTFLPRARTAPVGYASGSPHFNGCLAHFLRHRDALAVVWNGQHGRRADFVAAARATGTRVLFVEQSPVPDHLQIDAAGINCHHSMDRSVDALRAWDAASAYNPDDWRPVGHRCVDIAPRRSTGVGQDADGPLPEGPFILLPLQRARDNQVTACGDWIGSIGQLIEEVARAAHHLPPGWRILVKPHPRSRQAELEALRGLEAPGLQVEWRTRTSRLLAAANAVLTLNSSVGLHAFYRNKPVLLLGHALYDTPGAVTRLTDAGALTRALQNPDAYAFDQHIRNAIMNRLTFEVLFALCPTGSGRLTDAAATRLGQRIAAGWQ